MGYRYDNPIEEVVMAITNSLLNNTIMLDVSNTSPRREAPAEIAIWPGQIVAYLNSGAFTRPPLLGEPLFAMFAVENGYGGGSIYDFYDPGQLTMAIDLRKGDRILTKIDSGTIAFGTPLTGNTLGWLQQAVGTEYIVALCDEYDPSPTYPRWTPVRIV
jgi:hypothetical protein